MISGSAMPRFFRMLAAFCVVLLVPEVLLMQPSRFGKLVTFTSRQG